MRPPKSSWTGRRDSSARRPTRGEVQLRRSASAARPFGLRVAPDFLQPRWGDGEAGVLVGGDRLEGDQVDAAPWREARTPRRPGGVAGVAAAGDEEEAGLR